MDNNEEGDPLSDLVGFSDARAEQQEIDRRIRILREYQQARQNATGNQHE